MKQLIIRIIILLLKYYVEHYDTKLLVTKVKLAKAEAKSLIDRYNKYKKTVLVLENKLKWGIGQLEKFEKILEN